jgi:hypothetical protein
LVTLSEDNRLDQASHYKCNCIFFLKIDKIQADITKIIKQPYAHQYFNSSDQCSSPQKVWDVVTKAEYGLQFILKDDVIVFVNNIIISSFKMLLSQ